ncbi:MAG: hypothetical protein IPM40_08115 [Gammaproteobacteria bacterium]|nr:hypothetical protein [Gammaproteobacteria bacterium]
MRKRPAPGIETARFISSSCANCWRCSSSRRAWAIPAISPGFIGSVASGFSAPWNFAHGGAPVLR